MHIFYDFFGYNLGNYRIIEENSGILQQSLGIVQALKCSEIQQLELLICLEMQILQNITTSRDSTSVLSQVFLFVMNLNHLVSL